MSQTRSVPHWGPDTSYDRVTSNRPQHPSAGRRHLTIHQDLVGAIEQRNSELPLEDVGEARDPAAAKQGGTHAGRSTKIRGR